MRKLFKDLVPGDKLAMEDGTPVKVLSNAPGFLRSKAGRYRLIRHTDGKTVRWTQELETASIETL